MNFNQIATTLKNLKPAATIITPSNHGCGLTNNIIKFVAEEWNITPIPVLVYDVLTIKEICGKFTNNPVCLIIEEFNKQPLITRKFIINSLIGGDNVLPVGSKIILINDCDNPSVWEAGEFDVEIVNKLCSLHLDRTEPEDGFTFRKVCQYVENFCNNDKLDYLIKICQEQKNKLLQTEVHEIVDNLHREKIELKETDEKTFFDK